MEGAKNVETQCEFRNTTISNLKVAFIAQFFSFFVSMLMSLIVPKLIDIEQFSYWQLFLFYANYVGLFLFGLNDGIYLRIGGEKYSDINKTLVGTQFKLSVITQSIAMLFIIVYAMYYELDTNRFLVVTRVSLYLLVFNLHGFLGYIMQAVNLTKIYSQSIIIEKVAFCMMIIFLITVKANSFIFFINSFIICKTFSFAYLLIFSKELISAKICPLKLALSEMKLNTSVGINLMIANISNSLILGAGRLMIDKKWDVITFGKVSLALSLVNFFLMFINQISMVLFPALRRVTYKQLLTIYTKIRNLMGYAISSVLLCYIPMKILLSWWLPQYEKGIYYLIFLLPVCTYDGKMNMICNTFFKVLRREKVLLAVNVSSMLVSVFSVYISAFLLQNLDYVLASMTFSIAFRCVLSELLLSKMLGVNIIREIIEEGILVLVFIFSSLNCKNFVAFLVQLILFIFYIFINRNKIKQSIPKSLVEHK